MPKAVFPIYGKVDGEEYEIPSEDALIDSMYDALGDFNLTEVRDSVGNIYQIEILGVNLIPVT